MSGRRSLLIAASLATLAAMAAVSPGLRAAPEGGPVQVVEWPSNRFRSVDKSPFATPPMLPALRVAALAPGRYVRYARSVALTDTGVAVGADDGSSLFRWDGTAPVVERRIAERIWSSAISSDGARLVTLGDKLELWRMPEMTLEASWPGPRSSEVLFAMSGDGTRLALLSRDGTGQVIELPGGREVLQLKGLPDDVRVIALDRRGLHLAAGTTSRKLLVKELTGGRTVFQSEVFEHQVEDAALLPDGDQVLSSSVDGTLRLFQVSTGQESVRFRLSLELGSPDEIALSADATRMAVRAGGAGDGGLVIWDLVARAPLAQLDHGTNQFFRTAFSPDGRKLVLAGDKDLRTFDLSGLRPVASAMPSEHRPDTGWQQLLAAIDGDAHHPYWLKDDGEGPPDAPDGAGESASFRKSLARFVPAFQRLLPVHPEAAFADWKAGRTVFGPLAVPLDVVGAKALSNPEWEAVVRRIWFEGWCRYSAHDPASLTPDLAALRLSLDLERHSSGVMPWNWGAMAHATSLRNIGLKLLLAPHPAPLLERLVANLNGWDRAADQTALRMVNAVVTSSGAAATTTGPARELASALRAFASSRDRAAYDASVADLDRRLGSGDAPAPPTALAEDAMHVVMHLSALHCASALTRGALLAALQRARTGHWPDQAPPGADWPRDPGDGAPVRYQLMPRGEPALGCCAGDNRFHGFVERVDQMLVDPALPSRLGALRNAFDGVRLPWALALPVHGAAATAAPASCEAARGIALAALERMLADGHLEVRMFSLASFQLVVDAGYLSAMPACPDGGTWSIPESSPHRPELPVRITCSNHP